MGSFRVDGGWCLWLGDLGCYLVRDLKEMRISFVVFCESVLVRENNECRGFEEGVCLICLRIRKEVSVVGGKWKGEND